METKPATVFKYERLSVLSLQNLKRQSVYFAPPTQFNDPYDCTITAAIDEPTAAEIETLREHFRSRSDYPERVRKEITTLTAEQLQATLIGSVKGGVEKAIANFIKHNGVTCFAERNNDLLMWSHYGGSYQGFCLEFRTEYEPFTKLKPVKYVDEMPHVNLTEFLVNDEFDAVGDLYCTKSRAWEYEREWRVLHKEAGTLFTYKKEALKAIYFGPRMDFPTKEIICLILRGQNRDVEFWDAHQIKDRFQLGFEKFTYTSFVEAQRTINEKNGPNAACFCGSGKKVKHCCGMLISVPNS